MNFYTLLQMNFRLQIRRTACFSVKQTYKYYVSEHYPSSCLFFKTQRFRDWILSPSSGKTYSFGPVDRASPYLRSGRWIMSRCIIFLLMCHRRKRLDLLKQISEY
jgi:hypothetical protein